MIRFTDDQRLAIECDSRSPILVSAAAGSGKTTVLSERVTKRLEEGRVKPAELLVMTFTEKAAQHMRDKIERRFEQAVKQADEAERERLEAIQKALPDAEISTIHAFCNRLLSEFIADLPESAGIAPGYRVLEPEQADRLLEMAVRDVLDAIYRLASRLRKGLVKADRPVRRTFPESLKRVVPCSLQEIRRGEWVSGFLDMTKAYAPDYDDSRLVEGTQAFLKKLRSLPDYHTLLEQALADRERRRFFSAERTAARRDRLRERLEPALADLATLDDWPYVADLDRQTSREARVLEALLANQKTELPCLRQALEKDDWHDAVVAIVSRLKPVALLRKAAPEHPKSLFEARYKRHLLPLLCLLTDQIRPERLRDACSGEGAPCYTETRAVIEEREAARERLLARFVDFVLLVDARYRERKARVHAVDFADFEHEALRLLRRPEIAERLALRYRELYLDEYQDTSSIQDAVVQQLSSARHFMVGDVKQSIYRFRHANPALFLEKADRYLPVTRPEETGEPGNLLLLNRNFRSRPALIDFVNLVFSRLLADPAGEIVYDARHRLVAAREAQEAVAVDILLVDVGQLEEAVDDEEDVHYDWRLPATPLDLEATAAVTHIQALLDEGRQPAEIAVLARREQECAAYYRALSRAGLPVSGRNDETFQNSAPFRLFTALIRFLVNGRDAIALTALLVSPLAVQPLTEEELLTLRLTRERKLPFVDLLRDAARQAPQGVLASSLRRFDGWRRLASEMAIADFARTVLAETAYGATLASQEDGDLDLRQLERLLSWLEGVRPSSLRDLVELLNRLSRQSTGYREKDIRPGTVQVLTMHAAKGLEFPVVFLAGLNVSKRKPESPPVLLSEHAGLTCGLPAGGLRGEDPLHEEHLWLLRKAEAEEELRLLYVALTRAGERLFLVGGEKARKKDGKLTLQENVSQCLENKRLSHRQILAAPSAMVRLLAALGQPDKLWPFLDRQEDQLDLGGIRLRRESPVVIREKTAAAVETAAAGEKETARLIRLLDPVQGRSELADLPAKLTVSELKRQQEQLALQDEEGALLLPPDMAYLVNRPDHPAGSEEARELGTKLHTLFQFLDFGRLAKAPDSYAQQLDEMASLDRLAPEDRTLLLPYAGAAQAFADSEIGRLLRLEDTRVYREMPFTAARPIAGHPDEFTLVQGMIDLWYRLADGRIGLVDFKSVRLPPATPQTWQRLLTERYQTQLAAYAAAIESALKKPVHWSWIWLIRQGIAIPIERPVDATQRRPV